MMALPAEKKTIQNSLIQYFFCGWSEAGAAMLRPISLPRHHLYAVPAMVALPAEIFKGFRISMFLPQ
jgi:hypothetical protein